MNCYIVMAMLVVMGFDVSDGRDGDCNINGAAGMTTCQFLCGFRTPWLTCENDLCCCGYSSGWESPRYNEGERCSGDAKRAPVAKVPCDPESCHASCGGGNSLYECSGNCCLCPYISPGDGTMLGWRNKYCNGGI